MSVLSRKDHILGICFVISATFAAALSFGIRQSSIRACLFALSLAIAGICVTLASNKRALIVALVGFAVIRIVVALFFMQWQQ